jgi:hypothetical protein
MAAGLLLTPWAWADDKKDTPPPDKPPAKEPATPKEKYDALVKEFTTQRSQLVQEINKAKDDERQKLVQKYYAVGKDFGDRFYKIYEDDPKSPVATEALFWILQNANGSDAFQKAAEKATTFVADMPTKELLGRLNRLRVSNLKFVEAVCRRAEKEGKDPQAIDLLTWVVQQATGGPSDKAADVLVAKLNDLSLKDLLARLNRNSVANPKLLEAMFKRAEKEEKEAQAPDLLLWVVMRGSYLPVGQKALDQLVDKFPDNAAVGQAFYNLTYTPTGEETLKQYLEKAAKDQIKGWAAVNLGRMYRTKTDRLKEGSEEEGKLMAEAEKYLEMASDKFGKDSPQVKKEAQRELNIIRHLRVGKEALDIVGADLDNKDFKLSDYRGKVVLLDFWGNW